MSSKLKRFNQLFGIQTNIEEERQKFVTRVNENVFKPIGSALGNDYYAILLERICYDLGINFSDLIERANRNILYGRRIYPPLRSLSGDEFLGTLRIVVLLYEHRERQREFIDLEIKNIISSAHLDLGIRWNDGLFYPSGAPQLDKLLVDNILGVLNSEDRKEIYNSFQKSLLELLKANDSDTGALKDCLRDSYESLESAAKIVCENEDDLSANRELLISKIKSSEYYSKILKEYIAFANQYRHGKKDDHKIKRLSRKDAEAFVYLTGIFLRLSFIER